jgi:hypothetical protein
VLGLWWVNLFSPASPEVGHLTNPTLVSGVKICLNLNLKDCMGGLGRN